ncbi:MAG: tRNA (adenosine(37)-N6)-threonylcarbamoyltransferase complex dimerization subunit type 1 TsaB [Peptococcaceae bacterium]|nr:tRNA (adenosine(37)-N6)-threonylcarbamoyltransferase complex dimerization subunit type 1 TsaB [Peptococcaceae bacterium]
MWLLSIDTASKVTGLALNDNTTLVAESFLHTGKNHSERLMPMVLQILANAGVDFSDLGAVAVTSGPGSFTGLRIGMATAKGIAQVKRIPILGINTLDALAQGGLGFNGVVVPILDARKDEVYTASYRAENGKVVLLDSYRAISPRILSQELRLADTRVLFLGDGVATYKELLEEILGHNAVFLPERLSLPRAANVGALAAARMALGSYDDLYTLKPMYIRQSEAEVTWAKKFGQGGC